MPRPTLNDIARHLGVSKMSVSRALRGERHVAEELRQRVKTAAEALNYRPDPEITKLMTHMRGARGQVAAQTLGVVWADKKPGAVAASPWSRELAAGMHERARQLGFQVDQFYLDEAGMNPRRLAEILEARGIDGFILSPLLSRSRGHISMPWERFSSVVIGLGYARPALNRVHHHHYLGMMTAMRRLKRLGYRRIGFFGPAVVNERMFGAWSASFITHHPLPALEALDLLCLRKVASRAELTAWLQKAQPEVVIEGGQQAFEWLAACGRVPEDVGYVTLNWSADHPGRTGIDQQAQVLGGAAVDLLVTQLQRNERGLPEHPRFVMTEGEWREGQTVRRCKPAAKDGKQAQQSKIRSSD